jgi:hypothetical protein
MTHTHASHEYGEVEIFRLLIVKSEGEGDIMIMSSSSVMDGDGSSDGLRPVAT